MNKRNRRYKAKESKVKSSSKPKVIRINLSLLIGIIVLALILVSSLTGHKISTMGTKVFANLVEEVTDGDDTWEIVNMSESEEENSNEEQIASVSESSDDGVSTASLTKSSIYNVGASTINYSISDFSDYDTMSYSGDLKKYSADSRNSVWSLY